MAVGLLIAGLAGWGVLGQDEARLTASTGTWFQDTDGDQLPDHLEWALLTNPGSTDSDSDGTDDFLEAAQFQVTQGLAYPLPTDHEMRMAISSIQGQVLLNLIIRVVPGETIESVTPFVELSEYTNGQVSSTLFGIESAFWAQVVDARHFVHPTEGSYYVISSWLCHEEQLKTILPCAIGVSGQIGTKTFENGGVLMDIDDTVASLQLMPDTTYPKFTFQPLEDQDPLLPNPGGGPTFWQSAKACEVELVTVGNGGGQVVTQAIDARCIGAPTMLCAPSCTQQTGRIILVPRGIPFLTGN